MKITKINNNDVKINNYDIVTVVKKGDYIEQIYNSHKNWKAHTIRINSTQYVKCSTGEICNYNTKSLNKSQNINSVMKTMKRIRDLVQTNVRSDNYKKILFVTLTYEENQRNPIVLRKDFDNFINRIYRYSKKHQLCKEGNKPRYLSVIEPQDRGSFHYHIFLFFDFENPFIPNEEISKMWNKGFCTTKAIDDPLRYPNYLLAYLSDLDISDDKVKYFPKKDIKKVEVDGTKKSIVKGGRLYLYPSQFKILRYSRDLDRPIKKVMSGIEAKKMAKGKELIYETSYVMENNGYETTINRKILR